MAPGGRRSDDQQWRPSPPATLRRDRETHDLQTRPRHRPLNKEDDDGLILTPQQLQTLHESSASSKASMGKSSDHVDAPSSSSHAEAATRSPAPPISARKPAGWNHQFFIRVDLGGLFHTYPQLGGPFPSLEEAENAILRRLDELRDPKMLTNDGLSRSEIAIRDALHWPDGTRKYASRSNPDRDHVGLLVQALLDKHNEENNLLGDLAYQVEGVVNFREVYEGRGRWYYHLNCTRKTSNGGGADNLFFVEALKMIKGQNEEFELTCVHILKPADNGPCYGCTNDSVGMKHPIDAGKYRGGHDPNPPWPRCTDRRPLGDLPQDFETQMKAMEERIRNLFRDCDDVATSAAGTRAAASDGSMRSMEGRVRYMFGVRYVAKPDAGTRTAVAAADGLDKSHQGRTGKYVVPARRR